MAKKITAIVSLTLVGIIVAAIIIMANITVDHNIDYATPSQMWVTYNSSTPRRVDNEEDKEKILSLMDEATQEKYLNALLTKTLDKKPEIKQNKTTKANIPSTTKYYVIFEFGQPQHLEGIEEDNVYYRQLVFAVAQSEGEVETKVYISEDGDMTYRYYYLITVDYSEIFNYLTNNGYQG